MIINVTQEDIDTGIPGSFKSCPVAKAIRRQIPGSEYIAVSNSTAVFTLRTKTRKHLIFSEDHFKSYAIPLSKRVGKFIHNFDIGGPTDFHVSPFSFELEI